MFHQRTAWADAALFARQDIVVFVEPKEDGFAFVKDRLADAILAAAPGFILKPIGRNGFGFAHLGGEIVVRVATVVESAPADLGDFTGSQDVAAQGELL